MLKKRWFSVVGVAVVLSLALLVAACGGDDDDGNGDDGGNGDNGPPPGDVSTSLDVVLDEFSVSASLDSAGAGTVTFGLVNDGTMLHNFRVIATDLAADALPVIEDEFIVDEGAVDVLAASADLDVGGSEDVSVELEAGSYVLICNVPGHYTSGMFTAFTVQ